jgi:hypothetical protein
VYKPKHERPKVFIEFLGVAIFVPYLLSRDHIWLQKGFRFVVGFIEHLQNITTNNYDSLTELYTPMITVTTAHIKSSQSSLAVAW